MCTALPMYPHLRPAGMLQASRGSHRMLRCLPFSITEEEAVRTVVAPFLAALEYLHSLQIIHRDIKPENLLFSTDGTLKVGGERGPADARCSRHRTCTCAVPCPPCTSSSTGAACTQSGGALQWRWRAH